MGGKSGGRILVKEAKGTCIDGLSHCLPTGCSSEFTSAGKPGRIMGIKVTED
jgi:hypothetical protein